MTTKAELLAEIAAEAEDVLYTVEEPTAQDPNWPTETSPNVNGDWYRTYRTNIYDKTGRNTQKGQNILWYTKNEVGDDPNAEAKYLNQPNDKNLADAIGAYLEGLGYDGYALVTANREQKFAIVTAYDGTAGGTGVEKQLFIGRAAGDFYHWDFVSA